MEVARKVWIGLFLLIASLVAVSAPALAQQQQKPNIIMIMGDDIGIWNIGAYHHGLMAGRTPNIDQLATDGHVVHRLLRRGELHGRASKLYHWRIADPHGHDDRGASRFSDWFA